MKTALGILTTIVVLALVYGAFLAALFERQWNYDTLSVTIVHPALVGAVLLLLVVLIGVAGYIVGAAVTYRWR